MADSQTATVSPVVVGGDLPYRLSVRRLDYSDVELPSLHSFAAGEYDGQWVLIGGLTNGLHGFDIDQGTIPESKQNRDVWVIDPETRQSWRRTLDPADAGSGLTDLEVLSITPANTEFEQVGDRLYVTGGYGDNDPNDDTARGTFGVLSEFDLSGLVDWAKGGAGQASDHLRQVEDELFQVTGGSLHEVDGKMHLVFGQDYEGRYRGRLNGEYTKQVRTFTIEADGADLEFTHLGSSTPEEHYRRRDLNVYSSLSVEGDQLVEGITVLSGVFTETDGIWTVPVEITADGVPTQADGGLDAMNAGGVLDAEAGVFKQAMNNYHSAKFGLFDESTGSMHEVLLGGITYLEYDPTNPAADADGFVADGDFPNTNQITSVIRNSDGSYEQHYLGEFPEMYTLDGERMRFGANAEFFLTHDVATYDNGVIDLDALTIGQESHVGYVYGGLIANAPHVFGNPIGLSSASGEIWEVVVMRAPEPAGLLLVATPLAVALGCRRRV
ncbi:hypothetical protein Mal64_32260 [Pseudobythopirellula maris]|uniref:PEP-CTERM protein-sorting domain-containing protein n=2 Tax=Pseudobythopirellula maris TaxID=2527991 RepID=A0A5C5ZML3_9BACT|nr:hypothetical protein Mal64_32260 [Pseudobythopirellula maris]